MDLLGYKFKNQKLLELALTHRSSNLQRNEEDNERLEFLGDAVLDLAVSEFLLHRFPNANEGRLSKLRATLVNERTLAMLARSLGLGAALKLGKGEESSGGRDKDSILSSALEALTAAIHLDGGFQASRQWLETLFEGALDESALGDLVVDYKTRLQEAIQAKLKTAPTYNTVKSTGPDHDKTFEVEIQVLGKSLGRGWGKSKKEAEQKAAQAVYDKLDDKLKQLG
jgi:ribonuclease-3